MGTSAWCSAWGQARGTAGSSRRRRANVGRGVEANVEVLSRYWDRSIPPTGGATAEFALTDAVTPYRLLCPRNGRMAIQKPMATPDRVWKRPVTGPRFDPYWHGTHLGPVRSDLLRHLYSATLILPDGAALDHADWRRHVRQGREVVLVATYQAGPGQQAVGNLELSIKDDDDAGGPARRAATPPPVRAVRGGSSSRLGR